ncbi:hypothetical protein MARA_11140 [Mycolicibacterium arabiense]|uniref:Helix-turn-helix domain-containing protein n=1 Tax=Mycolicibacterium arabiense TaxID=1286181 RepID=A0A7I7RUE7_9MYCO|nr:helix-turn-helix domain-containing protein [Mycolicibacterium arabiense]MCV7375697.1 helix-turn-helix domain-containing protein [Mycolicibacterium arabiense]BBY47646.1 hypothetical protein MARA_11140 [Mycolicibacterium arabiense]
MPTTTGPLLQNYAQAMVTLGHIGRSSLYELIDAGEITRVKIGRRAFITTASIAAYVDRLVGALEGAA